MNQRAMWLSLVWKEWREHRWKMASLAAIAVAVPIAVGFEDPGSVLFAVEVIIWPYAVLAAFFLGAGIAAGEETNQTAGFLQALPTEGRYPAWAKLTVGLATALAPAVALVAGAYAWTLAWPWLGVDYYSIELRGAGGPGGWFASTLCVAVLVIASLLIWVAASGVGRKDEISAGAFAVAAISLAAILVGAASHPLDRAWSGPEWVFTSFVSLAPAGYGLVLMGVSEREGLSTSESVWLLGPAAVVVLVTHGLLIWRYLARFGQPTVEFSYRDLVWKPPQERAWLGAPRRSPLTAIVWQQSRVTLPVAVVGTAAMLGLALLFWLLTGDARRLRGLALNIMAMWCNTAILVSIVAGIGAFLDDLSPGLHTFWRSRPIHVDQWFWLKFLTALLVPLLVMCPIALATSALVLELDRDPHFHLGPALVVRSPVIWAVLLPVFTFCAAVVAICLVRRPLYAAVFTACVWVVMYLFVATWKLVPYTPAGVGAIGAVLSVGCALAGWQALRHDIGWQR